MGRLDVKKYLFYFKANTVIVYVKLSKRLILGADITETDVIDTSVFLFIYFILNVVKMK
jgi:hypothetical protein